MPAAADAEDRTLAACAAAYVSVGHIAGSSAHAQQINEQLRHISLTSILFRYLNNIIEALVTLL